MNLDLINFFKSNPSQMNLPQFIPSQITSVRWAGLNWTGSNDPASLHPQTFQAGLSWWPALKKWGRESLRDQQIPIQPINSFSFLDSNDETIGVPVGSNSINTCKFVNLPSGYLLNCVKVNFCFSLYVCLQVWEHVSLFKLILQH